MRAPRWLYRRESDSFQRLLLAPVSAAALVYGVAAGLRRGARHLGLLPTRRLPCCVISVGSPVVGGSGKTPTAAWLAVRLKERGYRVALACRGHGGALGRGVRVLGDGRSLVGDPNGVGDEALVLFSQAPGVPVVVGRSRFRAGLTAIATLGTEVLVLDDALAHHALDRDLEIATLDASTGFGNGAPLPRGPLRESLLGLGRIDALGVIDGELEGADRRLAEKWAPEALRFEAARRPVSVRRLDGAEAASPSSLAGMSVGVLSGLARPKAFEHTLETLGVRIVARREFADHHRYTASDLRGLEALAETWITTEKDAVKILPSWTRELDLRVLRIALEVTEAAGLLDWVESRLRAAGTAPEPVRTGDA